MLARNVLEVVNVQERQSGMSKHRLKSKDSTGRKGGAKDQTASRCDQSGVCSVAEGVA